jgi:tRNA threonylcarbamoyladenosine modification (KEOPS) complex  Pcc1 subunit
MGGNAFDEELVGICRGGASNQLKGEPSLQKKRVGGLAYSYVVEIDFRTGPHATWALQSLELDLELRPNLVQRQLAVTDRQFRATFHSRDAHVLRTAVNAFYDALRVAIEVLDRFQNKT